MDDPEAQMRIRPFLLLMATVLAVPLVGTAPVAADTLPVVAMSGALTSRPPGYPKTDVPARQLASASARVMWLQNSAAATVTLKAVPDGTTSSTLRLTLGVLDGTNCEGLLEYATPTTGTPAAGWSRSGSTYALASTSKTMTYDFNCASAALTPPGAPDPATTHDVLIGPLNPEYAQPALAVTSVSLLGKPKVKLVPGVWTELEVGVENTGRVGLDAVTVTGAGKRLKVRPSPATSFPAGLATTVRMQVRLTRKKATTLTVTAAGGGTAASTSVKVKPVAAPPRIRDGRYRTKDKAVTFKVQGGRIKGFRVRAQTRCGGYPDLPTYTTNDYSLPTAKVSRAGIVTVVERGSNYGARLEGRASGSKVKAVFTYSGPNRCSATVKFVARRRG